MPIGESWRHWDPAATPLGEISLLTSSVKPNSSIGKAHAFDLITPNRTYYFAVKDANELKAWMDAISKAIKKAIEGTSAPSKLSASAPGGTSASNRSNGSESASSPASPPGSSSPTSLPQSSGGGGSPSLSRSLPKSPSWVYTQASTPTTGYLYRMKNGGYARYYIEVRGDNMYFFPAEKRAAEERRQSSCPVMLTLCAVRLNSSGENESSFQVVTPTETLELKAETTNDAVKWITVFNNAASLFKRRGMTEAVVPALAVTQPTVVASPPTQASSIASVAAIPPNKICVDCSDKDPQWASINLGVFMCIECSGVHRSLGTHISKVRSIDLDKWEPDVIKFMQKMGNEKSNAIWEFKPEALRSKPNPSAPRADKANFITLKYKLRQWADVSKLPKEEVSSARTASTTQASSTQNTQPSKQVYFEGFLTKQGNNVKNWKLRWFVLQDNKLSYFATKNAPSPIDSLNLATAHIRSSPEITNLFEVILPYRTYFLQAETSDEFFKWIDTLKESQQFYLANK